MNFLKNSFLKMFRGEEKPQIEANLSTQIPKDVLEEIFSLTAKLLSESKTSITDESKLNIYGLYKQATIGDCNTPKPALYDFVAKSKWEAWNSQKGCTQETAMKKYIAVASQIDSTIPTKMQAILLGEEERQNNLQSQQEMKIPKKFEGPVLRQVEKIDYSSQYSHPYFKAIEKNQLIVKIEHEELMKINNNPKVYPLHFAIDKERKDLVPRFLELLSVQEVQSMKDQEGTSILEYAELIENQEILKMIKQKLAQQ